ncbi:MAG: hypothetical protein ACYCS4_11100 [Acidimicrobiales bacterium]
MPHILVQLLATPPTPADPQPHIAMATVVITVVAVLVVAGLLGMALHPAMLAAVGMVVLLGGLLGVVIVVVHGLAGNVGGELAHLTATGGTS